MSRVEALNYFRQASPAIRQDWLRRMLVSGHQTDAMELLEWLETGKRAVKFVLPDGGRILDDDLRGLPRELRLPFHEVLIEYHAEMGGRGIVEEVFGDSGPTCPRRIVIARQDGDWIEVYSVVQDQKEDGLIWRPLPFAGRVRSTINEPGAAASQIGAKSYAHILLNVRATGTLAPTSLGADWPKHAACDLADEVRTVLELIEALTCSNVSHAPLDVRKPNKSSIRKGALPFDEYRALVINAHRDARAPGAPGAGSNRSPREHLRRGHIRRLSEDRTVWVNATVVAAGSAGQLSKSYMVRNSA